MISPQNSDMNWGVVNSLLGCFTFTSFNDLFFTLQLNFNIYSISFHFTCTDDVSTEMFMLQHKIRTIDFMK